MKTMGLSQLVLVNPLKFPHYEATKRAAGADSVLQTAVVVDDLRTAIADCTLVMGTSVRDREVSWPTVDPRQAAQQMLDHLAERTVNINEKPSVAEKAAILFGRESSGLSNQELDLCQSQIRIPANTDYSSLNLGSAVQIIAYEMRMCALAAVSAEDNENKVPLTAARQRQQSATRAQKQGHLDHLYDTLQQLEFIKSDSPTILMRKLTRLYNKAQLSIEEVQILRGVLTAIQTRLERSKAANVTQSKK